MSTNKLTHTHQKHKSRTAALSRKQQQILTIFAVAQCQNDTTAINHLLYKLCHFILLSLNYRHKLHSPPPCFLLSFTHIHRCEQTYTYSAASQVSKQWAGVLWSGGSVFFRQWLQSWLSKADKQLTNNKMSRICLLALMAGFLLGVRGLAVEIAEKKAGKQPRMVSGHKKVRCRKS